MGGETGWDRLGQFSGCQAGVTAEVCVLEGWAASLGSKACTQQGAGVSGWLSGWMGGV